MFRFHRIIFGAVPLVIGISIWLHIMLPCEGDKGWLLHVARLWLQGSPLYVKIMELNPPLILWFYAVPVWISLHVSWITDYEALAIIGLIGCACSIAAGTKIISRHPAFEGRIPDQIKFAGLQALIFIFYTSQSYFFDREHILIVMAFPYMLRFMPTLADQKFSTRLRIAIGCMAAVGFGIKPHTILVFVALQLFALVRTRSFKSLLNLENVIIVALGLLYALAILIFTPDYYRYVVPMALETYGTFKNENAGYVFLPPVFLALGIIFADFRPWQTTPYRRDVYYLAAICLTFILYAKINNGWGYTYNPVYCSLMLLTGWMMWEYNWLRLEYEARGLSTRHIMFGMRGCFLVFTVHAAYMLFYLFILGNNLEKIRFPCEGNPDCWRNSPYEQYLQDHHIHSFGTISFDFSNWVSLMRLSGTDWNSRFNHEWMLPKLLLEGPAYTQAHYWIVEYVAKNVAENLEEKKPDVVFVDGSPGLLGRKMDLNLPGFLSGVPEFKKAWSHYRFTTTFDHCPKSTQGQFAPSECKYDLYTRMPGSPEPDE